MISVGMSTCCVYPGNTEAAFRLASEAGFDGVELMITSDPRTRSARRVAALAERFAVPVLSVHAPVLLLSQFVWGVDSRVKLERASRLARDLDAPTVVVHPPFAWQRAYARRFVRTVGEIADSSGRLIAVENMFPWAVASRRFAAYAPHHDPSQLDVDAMTLDFSHAAAAGEDSLDLARRMGDRLRHVHLTDGSALRSPCLRDEHLVPGRGAQPVARVLEHLSALDWSGSVVAEVSTRRARSEEQRMALLTETLGFARAAIARGAGEVRGADATDARATDPQSAT